MTDPNRSTITNTYDTSDRVISQTDPLSRRTSYTYTTSTDGAGSTVETDPRGIQIKYDYVNLRLTATTRGLATPQAAMTRYAYDPATLAISSVTDPNGHTTTYTYDARGDKLTETDPLGRKTVYTYNAFNEVTGRIDALGVKTTHDYDPKGNLLSTSTPIGAKSAVTTYAYGDSAHPDDVTARTDPDGRTSHYAFDTYGNRTSATDANGDTTHDVYNLLGELISTASPLGHKTTYTYDPFGDVQTITNAQGRKVVYGYDKNLNAIGVQDANGNSTIYAYDKANERTTATIKNRGGATITTWSTGFDTDGNVVSQIDGLGHSTTYSYDVLNRVASVTDPLGHHMTYAYDPSGNLLSLTDPQGRATSYAYDVANELTAITYSDRTTPNVTFKYDADGQRTSMADGTGSSSYECDTAHRLTKNIQGGGQALSYAYDLVGNLMTITYPDGKSVTRTYDGSKRLTSVADWLGNITHFSYDADSNLIGEAYPNGLSETLTYDAANRLTHTTDVRGPITLLDLAYVRDNVGLVSQENSSTYSYDGADRLITSTLGPSPYKYNKANQVSGIAGQSLSYNGAGELTSITGSSGPTTFSYDTQGNRTSMMPRTGPAASYSYDQANRLIRFVQGTTAASYAYNGDGLRMAKSVGTQKTYFAWDLADELPLMLQADGTSYVTGPGGLVLEQVTGTTVLFYHHDQLGSTRLLTDSSGTAVGGFTYDPYGTLHSKTGTAITPFGFAGQYADAESGLVYLRARYYDPKTAQFITKDPAEARTRMPYSYAYDTPTNLTDPTGLDVCSSPQWGEWGDVCRLVLYCDSKMDCANNAAFLWYERNVALQRLLTTKDCHQVLYYANAIRLFNIAINVMITDQLPHFDQTHWTSPILQGICRGAEGIVVAGVVGLTGGAAGAGAGASALIGIGSTGGSEVAIQVLQLGPCG